jgi:hypothetical protein
LSDFFLYAGRYHDIHRVVQFLGLFP